MIVDDDPMVLTALRTYFSSTQDIRVVAEASNGLEALKMLDNIDVDIILADIHMPEMDGVSLLRAIRQRENPPEFIAITALDTDDTMLEVLCNGGAGYIVKSSRPQAIISAMRDAVAGGTAISPHALKRLVGHLPDGTAPNNIHSAESKLNTLTANEMKILGRLCDGKSNAEIAEALQISESTVKKQVSNLIAAFGVTSRLSLAVAVIRAGYQEN